MDVAALTVAEAAALLGAGTCTARQLAEACLERIAAHDGALRSFVRVEPELALAQADSSDARRAAGQARGPLEGIPYSLKDVYATTDSPTTASSRMLDGWIAPYDATVYRLLNEAGAVMLGKTNTDELAAAPGSRIFVIEDLRDVTDRKSVV